MAGLLGTHYRAAHEPEREQFLGMILKHARGDVDGVEFREYFVGRDARLKLEYDIAWANQFIIDTLLSAFPQARFIVLIRDPYTWLQSICGHLISRRIPADVRAFLDWWFKPELYPHSDEDRVLQDRGLYSVAAFLQAWDRHIHGCTRQIPPEQLLVLRTHELVRSHERLAQFLQIPIDSLDRRQGNVNRGSWADRLESLIDRAYIEETVQSICRENMARYFPEVTTLESAGKLWDGWTGASGIR